MFVLLSMFDFLQSVCTTLILTLQLCMLLFLVSGSGMGKRIVEHVHVTCPKAKQTNVNNSLINVC